MKVFLRIIQVLVLVSPLTAACGRRDSTNHKKRRRTETTLLRKDCPISPDRSQGYKTYSNPISESSATFPNGTEYTWKSSREEFTTMDGCSYSFKTYQCTIDGIKTDHDSDESCFEAAFSKSKTSIQLGYE
ncbi:MAG: hypothetical protein KA436_01115 [Oligoflexales bacterium]|nr:hypothetical protein [Oligoflexales bacterium]